MSETMREALPILFMFGVAGLLGPLVGLTMWIAFDGDRLREDLREQATVTDEVRRAPEPAGVHQHRVTTAA
jgi:hypothetical protein